MNYIEIKVHCDAPFADILIAEMGELDFDTFVESEVGFDGYIAEDIFSHPALQTVFNKYREQTRIWYELNKIPKQNWNEEWEKNYDPIEIGDDSQDSNMKLLSTHKCHLGRGIMKLPTKCWRYNLSLTIRGLRF
jgi:accessory colonization factor AcfC